MKKILLTAFALILSVVAFAQDHSAKLSPLTKLFIQAYKKNNGQPPIGFLYKQAKDGTPLISALIKVNNAAQAAQSLETMGATVGTKAGDIWTVRVPIKKALQLVQASGISYIQLDEPVQPYLKQARKTTRVDSVHAGINLPHPYSGKGVIMGIMDFGFDYRHPTMYDTLHQHYRIKRVWELNSTGTPPAGFTYGREITDTNQIKAAGTDNAIQTHGTGVAGIACGSGYGSSAANNLFRGMAYDADMVLVGVRRDSIAREWLQGSFTDFVDGVNYIFTYSQSLGKPCALNISWGSQSGPHDGTTLMNQAFDNMTGPGKILIMSAGNDGQEKIHIAKTFTTTDTLVNTFLTFSSTPQQRTWVDVWGQAGKTFCGKATLYHNGVAGATSNFICLDDSTYNFNLIGSNGIDTCLVSFLTSVAEPNGKPRLTFDVYNKTTDSVGITVKANDGMIDMWNEYYYYGYTYGYQSAFDSLKQNWAINGNTVSTVSDMGAAQSVLLIGAYASKVAFLDINGNSWSYGGYVPVNKIVPFSSRGPMIDGRIKPDITAPGLTLSTAISSYDTAYTATGTNSTLTDLLYHDAGINRDFYYAEFSGTSASSPAAAGIVALLLQINPSLTPQDVKNILFATAIHDVHTGSLPANGNNTWGHGKINAYRAVKMALQSVSGVYNYSGEKLDCVVFPNPTSGSFKVDYESYGNENLLLEVYAVTGTLITQKTWATKSGINQETIDLTTEPTGVYMVKLSSAKGTTTVKVVKE